MEMLTGKTTDHVCPISDTPIQIHREARKPFQKLQKMAELDGFQIRVVSGFRDYEAQLNIWNQKARHQRGVLDDQGNPLNTNNLTPEALMFAILRWSALPGASRHHWGTEIDVIAQNLLPAGERPRLVPEESSSGGIFEKFNLWLQNNLPCEGFFRPYAIDKGGVGPEWWHLSYAPKAEMFSRHYTFDVFSSMVRNSSFELKAVIENNLQTIFDRFITNIDHP